MSDQTDSRALLERLAEEFVRRLRGGERPSLTEYGRAYPEHAAEIRELFPALIVMEELGPGDDREAADSGSGTDLTRPGRRERIGDYHLLREIGRGGMGVVYEAEQVSLGRRVALKLLTVAVGPDEAMLERFRREARAAAQLHHTNIVPVFEVGQDDGLCYYAMQLIHGQGLDEVVKELRRLRGRTGGGTPATSGAAPVAQSLLLGRFEVPDLAGAAPEPGPVPAVVAAPASGRASETSGAVTLPGDTDLSASGTDARRYFHSVARIGVQATEALAHAHQRGIIHRDIKPSNLLLDTAGIVWITDFGLAKYTPLALSSASEGAAADLTNTGDLVGTIRYMAPERFRGQCDARADVYGLGLTLYELLTLRPAFDGPDRLRLIEQIGRQEPPRPRSLDRRIPPDLETILLRATAKEPGQRYPSAQELADDLRRFLADRPIQARRSGLAEHAWRWCRRNPALAGLLTTVAVLLVAVAAVSTLAAVRLNKALFHTQKAEREARLHQAEALIGKAHGIRNSHKSGQRFAALAALGEAAALGRELGQPPEWFVQCRQEAIAALALPDLYVTQEWDGLPPGTHWVDLSADFALYVRTSATGACSIRRVADDSEVAALPALGAPTVVEFGPGASLVRETDSGRWQLWDLGRRPPVPRLEEAGVCSWSFHADGGGLALGFLDGTIGIYDFATGARKHRLAPTEVGSGSVALHPTAPLVVAWSYWRQPLQIRDLRTGAVVAQKTLPWRGNGNVAWTADGRTLAVLDGDSGQIQLFHFDPEQLTLKTARLIRAPMDGPGDAGLEACFNLAGDRLFTRGWANIYRVFDVATGQHLSSTPLTPSRCGPPRLDQAGKRLAAVRVGDQGERIGLCSVADAREYRALVTTSSATWNTHSRPAVHPNGRLAALGLTDGVALFDVDSGSELEHVPIQGGGSSVAFDGLGNLYTNGFLGCFRWPVRSDPTQPGRLTIGPPERLPFEAGDREISTSRDGRVIAQSMWEGYGMERHAGSWILHPDAPRPRHVGRNCSTDFNSVSPDGRWVVFSEGRGLAKNPLQVYEAASGRPLWQLHSEVPDHRLRGLFSPDGRWLVTNGTGGQMYAAGTWEPGPRLGPGDPLDVSSALSLVALGLRNGTYRLVELTTGRELARLEDPEQNRGFAVFTPDGTRLVVAAKNGLRVWDLRRLRQELAKLGLDWDAPPYPPPPEAMPPPLTVVMDSGSLLEELTWIHQGQSHNENDRWPEAQECFNKALQLNPRNAQAWYGRAAAARSLGQWDQALADLNQALKLTPDDVTTRYTLAWLLAICPQVERRDPGRAVVLARKAVELAPRDWRCWGTLGAAYCSAGDWQAAGQALEKTGKLQGRMTVSLLSLAKVQWQLGQKAAARQSYDQAVHWLQEDAAGRQNMKCHREEMQCLLAEAAQMLEVKDSKK